MLIPFDKLINDFNIKVSGILHVGAHNCEEFEKYKSCGVSIENMYWVEAMPNKIITNKQKYGEKLNIFQAVINDVDDKEVTFHITNNGESSSILEFGSHEQNHPHVKVVSSQLMKTTRLDTLIETKHIPIEKLNFINLDIQGVELRALKSMEKYMQHINYIYTEVNTEQVYKGCDEINEIDNYLKQFGFSRVASQIYSQYGWGDAFYVKNVFDSKN
jgi:FkbM family methyltransferase